MSPSPSSTLTFICRNITNKTNFGSQKHFSQTSQPKMPSYVVHRPPNPAPQYVYKVLPGDPKYAFPSEAGRVPQSHVFYSTPLDIESRFIHLTSSSVLPFVLDNFFTSPAYDLDSVYLIKLNYPRLSSFHNIRWEQDANDDNAPICPHLFTPELTGEFVETTTQIFKNDNSWKKELDKLLQNGWLQF